MINVVKNREAVNGFDYLVASYSTSEFDSPRRSTVLLLDYWRSFSHAVKSFAALIGVDFPNQSRLLFEYSVPVQAGCGKKSFTDLMLTGDSTVIAIEAKYTEGPYETVSKWLRCPDDQNRKEVLGGWLSLIQSRTGVSLRIDEISSLPYQLIHRSASACFAPASSRHVVYQVFDPGKRDYYSKCLHEMARWFQEGSTLSFWLMLCPFEPLDDYQLLLDQWERTTPKPKMSSQVKPMLMSRRLARFHEPHLVRFA